MEKLEKLKGLMAHQNFEGRYDRLFELLANLALKKMEPKEKAKKTEGPRSAQSAGNSAQSSVARTTRTRTIRTSIRRAVHLRDGGQCTRCPSRHALQFDHSRSRTSP
ncbi:MAG: hypothetical protein NDJ89_11255 [Oligoflexia bacterium]|nr:hypothetical protein [Oligoflexia bacterium]